MVEERDNRGRVIGVFKQGIYGDIPLEMISTAYIERHNLNLRHENRCLTRKTIAFSKKVEDLETQMHLYQGYFNLVRPHGGLKCLIPFHERGVRKWQPTTPAMAAGITDHIWLLKELMSKKIYINN